MTQAAPASPVSDELAGLFATFCLDRFPDQAALTTQASASRATVMAPQEVRHFLHDDPGYGWFMRTANGLYVLTIEKPPYQACAVRHMTPDGVPTVRSYIDAIKAYAERRGKVLINLPAMRTKTADGTGDVSLYSHGIADPGGKPTETFIVILTNYHGRPPALLRADAGNGVGVEVRFVHQFVH